MTTDSFVVKPLRFPGGSIGELAVNGTVNDLAVAGARPLALTVSMILEEGLDADVLRAEVEAIAAAARARRRRDRRRRHEGRRARRGRPDVPVHDRDRGRSTRARRWPPTRFAPGDQVLVSGPIGEHGTAIMLARDEFDLDADDRVRHVLAVAGGRRAARTRPARSCTACATRPAAASPRCSTSSRARRRSSVVVREADVPVSPVVAAAAELLGIDPMYVANEGRLVAFVAPEAADGRSAALRAVPGCEEAAAIGEVRREPPGMVLVETSFGGRRVMDQLVGDPLPRIC